MVIEAGGEEVGGVEDVHDAVVAKVALVPRGGRAAVKLSAGQKVGGVEDVHVPVEVGVARGGKREGSGRKPSPKASAFEAADISHQRGLILIDTVAFSAPAHGVLLDHWDQQTYDGLMTANLIRAWLWTAKGVVAVVMLVEVMRSLTGGRSGETVRG